jgi:hypothetical protein
VAVAEAGAGNEAGGANSREAIQKAIDAVAAAGGGCVRVPPGRFLTASLQLRSRVRLHLAKGAHLRLAGSAEEFPVLAKTENRPGQIQALVWADGEQDIAIEGEGTLDGAGEAPLSGPNAVAVTFRPALVFIRNCRNLRLEGVHLLNSSFWTLHLLRCIDVEIAGLRVTANPARINSDGIDPDGCRNVHIHHCTIRTGDDAIVIKSTEGDDCENIRIHDCLLQSSCAALKLGTESIGAIRHVDMRDCVIERSSVGLALYMKDGGAYEDVVFENIRAEVTNAFPLLVDVTPRWREQARGGTIARVRFANIEISGAGRCLVEGQAQEPIRDLSFTNVTWRLPQACPPPAGKKPTGSARVHGPSDEALARHTSSTHQFIFAHVQGLALENVRVLGAGGERQGARLAEVADLRGEPVTMVD